MKQLSNFWYVYKRVVNLTESFNASTFTPLYQRLRKIKVSSSAFTIIELLVVIVVIGILVTITIVSYTGIQTRAQSAAAISNLSANSIKIIAFGSSSGQYSTPDVMSGGQAEIKLNPDVYKYVSYCTNGSDFVLASQTKDDNKFYTKSSSTATQDNGINVLNPCNSLSISGTYSTTFANLPIASCAAESSTCTFTGTATIAYGYKPLGKFYAIANMSSPVSCNNTVFGDSAPNYGKFCYILYQ